MTTHRPGRAPPTMPRRVRDWFYPIPRETDTIEEYLRAHHHDLSALDAAALRREGRCAQLRLDYEPPGIVANWLTERIAAVRREMRLRGGGV